MTIQAGRFASMSPAEATGASAAHRFSPSEAALEGFDVIRAHWRVVAGWALFNIVALVAMVVATVVISFGLAAASSSGAVQLSGQLGEIFATVGTAFTEAVVAAGLFRLMLRPQEPGFLHLRLGADELRILGVWALMALAAFLLIGVCAALVLAGRGIGPGAAIAAWLAIVGIGVWLGLRFSLAAVATFAERRFALVSSWRLTRGHAWSLLGMAVLSACVVALLALLAALALMLVMGLSVGFGAMFEGLTDPEGLKSHPIVYLAQLAVQLALFPVAAVLLLAPWVSAYQAFRGEPT
jgi:hypothetical protein